MPDIKSTTENIRGNAWPSKPWPSTKKPSKNHNFLFVIPAQAGIFSASRESQLCGSQHFVIPMRMGIWSHGKVPTAPLLNK